MIPNHFTNELENVTTDLAMFVYEIASCMNHIHATAFYEKMMSLNTIVQNNDMDTLSGWSKIVDDFKRINTDMHTLIEAIDRDVKDKNVQNRDKLVCISHIIRQFEIACSFDYEESKKITFIKDKIVFMLKKLKQIGVNLKRSTAILNSRDAPFFGTLFEKSGIKEAFKSMVDRLISTGDIIVEFSASTPSTPLTSHAANIETLWAAVGKMADLMDT